MSETSGGTGLRPQLRERIAAQEATIRQIEQQSWGAGYLETSEGPVLTLPKNSEPYRIQGGGWAVRLSPK